MTFYLDEDLDPLITRLLRRRGIDDFIRLTHERLATAGPHAEVLIVTHRPLLRSLAAVATVLAAYHRNQPRGLSGCAVDFVGLSAT